MLQIALDIINNKFTIKADELDSLKKFCILSETSYFMNK